MKKQLSTHQLAFDAGAEWHKGNKEAYLAAVWREAGKQFPHGEDVWVFVEGFVSARAAIAKAEGASWPTQS